MNRVLVAAAAAAVVLTACTDESVVEPNLQLTLAPTPSQADPVRPVRQTPEPTASDRTEDDDPDPEPTIETSDTEVEYTLYTSGSILEETFDAGRAFVAAADGCPRPGPDLVRESCVVVQSAFGALDITVDRSEDRRVWQVRLHRRDTTRPTLVARTIATTSFERIDAVAFDLADGSSWIGVAYLITNEQTSVVEVYGWPLDATKPGLVALLPRVVSPELRATEDGLAVTHLYYAQGDDHCCPRGYLEGVIRPREDGVWVQRGTVRELR